MNNNHVIVTFKKYRWVGLVVFLLVILSLLILLFTTSDSKESPAMDADLPSCPSDTSGIFTEPFMDEGKPDFIIPLGNSNQSGHVVPVDHVYPTDVGYEENVPVYAPGDMTLVWVENKQMHNKNTGEVIAADYQLNFAPCRGLEVSFIHLDALSEKVRAAFGDENENCNSEQIDYGIQEGIPTYYVTCHPEVASVSVSAGELIGYFNGRTDIPNSGFDIGVYDYNKPMLSFVNPDRYYRPTLYTACFADYYIPELKAMYEEKLGGLASKGSDAQVFVQRTAEPVCGKVMYDVAGTAAGDWFSEPVQNNGQTDNEHALVLIHDNIRPELAKLSWGNVAGFTFTPVQSGTINREFSEVTADGNIYCYQSDDNSSASVKDQDDHVKSQIGTKYLLQLVDDTHLKIEQQSGVCGAGEEFQNSVSFER